MTWLAKLWDDLRYLARRADHFYATYCAKPATERQIKLAQPAEDWPCCSCCGKFGIACPGEHRWPCDKTACEQVTG